MQQSGKKNQGLLLFCLLISLFIAKVEAATLSGDINVDNTHTTYLSTDDATAGTLLVSGADWTSTQSFSSIVLTPGVPYFIHVDAVDAGGAAAFLGDFTITGGGHTFAGNNGTTITTDTSWFVSTTGWSSYASATGYGTNGVAPWGTRPAPADPTAIWIWSADNQNDNHVYFSMAIIPDPADLVISKTLDTTGPFKVGDTVQYTITVTNNGPGTAANVTIDDTPTNLTITNVSSTNCNSLPCTVNSISNSASEVITVTATIDAVGDFSNTATVSSVTPDLDTANNVVLNVGATASPVDVPTLSQWALLVLALMLLGLGIRQTKNRA